MPELAREGLPYLDLPSVHQQEEHTCGAACFYSMFLHFKGAEPSAGRDEMHFARELSNLELGYTPPENIVSLARAYGFLCTLKEGASLDDLTRALHKRQVLFVTWWFEDAGHYSLVKHLTTDHILLMDPWPPQGQTDHRIGLKDFVPLWRQRGAKMISVSLSPY